jgi:hypothetical protein
MLSELTTGIRLTQVEPESDDEATEIEKERPSQSGRGNDLVGRQSLNETPELIARLI